MTTFAAVRKNYGRLLPPEVELLEQACADAAASADEAAAAALSAVAADASADAALASEQAAAAALAGAVTVDALQTLVAASADFPAFKAAVALL